MKKYLSKIAGLPGLLSTLAITAVLMSAPPSSANVLSLKEIREAGVVMQQWDASCGAAALATVMTYHFGDPVSERAVASGLMKQTEPLTNRAFMGSYPPQGVHHDHHPLQSTATRRALGAVTQDAGAVARHRHRAKVHPATWQGHLPFVRHRSFRKRVPVVIDYRVPKAHEVVCDLMPFQFPNRQSNPCPWP